jgi:hypothetical protein
MADSVSAPRWRPDLARTTPARILMGLELQADGLKVRTGSLKYAGAFADLD